MNPKHKLNLLPENPEKDDPTKVVGLGRFPSWLHRSLPKGKNLAETSSIVSSNRLHTVCEEARCPNLTECWSKHTATFLIMGKECTRSCGFCQIDFSKAPKPLDQNEPERVALSVQALKLKHVVITMVARDDLEDGGAKHLRNTVYKIRELNPETTVEVLTSDFQGNKLSWDEILQAEPEIFNYNIETVRSLTPSVRHKATYERTLKFLNYAYQNKKNPHLLIKSGMMIGLGENEEEVHETLRDLKQAGCDVVTIGQYLQASRLKLRVKAFIHPDSFQKYADYGHSIGIKYVYAGPFVRSSYNANLVIQRMNGQTLSINSD